MSTLSEIFEAVRNAEDYRRARALAESDYKLLADLVAVRKARGLRQSDVAELLGISQQAVSKIESYDSDPKLSTLRMYANAIGALVAHAVEADTGQLADSSSLLAFSFVMPKTSYVRADGSFPLPGTKRADFALTA